MIVPGSSRVDLTCITKNKNKFTAEMQKSRKDFFIERCMVYNALIYAAQKDSNKEKIYFEQQKKFYKLEDIQDIIEESKQLETGYENVYPARLIGFLNFIQFPHRPEQHVSHYHLREAISNTRDIDPFSLTFIEFKKKQYNKPEDIKTNLDRWIYFFQNSNTQTIDQLLKFVGKDKTFEKAYQQLEYNSYIPSERKAIDESNDVFSSFKGAINIARTDGIERGRVEGREEGRHEAQIEMAKNLLKMNVLTAEQIAEASKLSIEDVRALKEER